MRWIVRTVFGLLGLGVVAIAVLFLLPAERIAKLAADRFEAATGRAMTLKGDVRPTLWPELGVNTGPVTIANAEWSEAGPMLRAERLSIGVDMLALLRGSVRIKRIEAQAPKLLIEIGKDGRGNWEMVREGGAAATETAAGEIVVASGIPEFTLDRAVLSGGALSFIDHAGGTRVDLSGIEATLRLPDFQGAADLELAAALHGQGFSVTAQIAEFAAFLAAGAVPVSATLTAGGSTLEFKGRAGMDPVAAGGRLEADLADLAAVFALIGQSAPDLPRGLGREIGLSGEVTAADTGRVTLRDGTIRLDHNTLTGAADVVLGARTKVTATLAAGALDLAGLTGGGGATGGGASAGAETGWSREAIDVSALQAVDAEIALQAASVDLGVAQVGATRLVTVLEAGRAVTEIREMRAYEGNVAGTVVVNSRGGLSARADLTGTGVRLKPLLAQLAGYDRLQTTGDVRVNLLGVGNSMAALMNGLSGEGRVTFGPGELAGLDLAGMLRTLDASYVGEGAKTIFESIGATFRVEGGVLSNEDLTLVAPLLTAAGKGRVGIGAQTLEYRVVPVVLQGADGGGIKVPLLITGTWAKPKFKLDLEGLAQERLGAEADKLKAQAEAAARARLSEELGVTLDDTKPVQGQLEDELEKRARKGLLDLLGGGN